MADEPSGLSQVPQQQPGPPQPDYSFQIPDWFLQILVNIVNTSDTEIGVTLQVGGFLVSGRLVGGAKYFDGFAADFANSLRGDQESTEYIRSAFSSYGEQLYSTTGETDAGPLYIHVKEARFFNTSGKPIPANRGVWWRGRLSEVSGFILGSLSEGL
jgi:hypothetical protein